jgi:integrase
MRRGEIQKLQWRQIDFLGRLLTVGASKTEAGAGRVIPLNDVAMATLKTWATNFADRKPEHFVFPSEHYGLAGDDRKTHAQTIDPNQPVGEVKTAWEAAKAAAEVECRFHDLRHTACTRLLERGASLPIVASIMGWSPSTTAKMAKRYGHIGSTVQRAALDALVNVGPSGDRPRNADPITTDSSS